MHDSKLFVLLSHLLNLNNLRLFEQKTLIGCDIGLKLALTSARLQAS